MSSQHAPGDGSSWWSILPTEVRYAIVQAGVVVAVVTMPGDQLPIISPGQTAQISNTLKVGDRV